MSDLLEHQLRRNMLEALAGKPGLTVGEMADALGVHYKTALHHARRLERAGHVVVARQGRRSYCYLPGERRDRPPAPRLVGALHAVGAGCATAADLARALGVPRGSAGSLLRTLERAGFVQRSDRSFRLREDVRRALAPEAFTAEADLGRAWKARSSAR